MASNATDSDVSGEAFGKHARKAAWPIKPCGAEMQLAVREAAQEEDLSHMLALLESGVALGYVGSDGSTALMEAAMNGGVEVLELLLEAGADAGAVDEDGRTAAMWAAWSGGPGSVAMLRALSVAGARLDGGDNLGGTALMRASARGSSECVEFLVEAGCDPNKRRDDGDNALKLAVRQGRLDCVEALIAAKSRWDDVDDDGMTPLMWAAVESAWDDVKVLDAMARAGANLDAIDKEGRTAIYHAARRGNEGALASLLKHGADPRVETEFKGSALFAAIANRNEGCAARLLGMTGPGAQRELDRTDREWRELSDLSRTYKMESIAGGIVAMLETRDLRRASLGEAPRDSRLGAGGKPSGAKRM